MQNPTEYYVAWTDCNGNSDAIRARNENDAIRKLERFLLNPEYYVQVQVCEYTDEELAREGYTGECYY